MFVRFVCKQCGRSLRADSRFRGARAHCPTCGEPITVPDCAGSDSQRVTETPVGTPESPAMPVAEPGNVVTDTGDKNQAIDAEVLDTPVAEFLDPPGAAPAAVSEPARPPIFRRMFEALLDPRSIQWMLTLGGVMAVLGLVVWLVSLGIFENRVVVAVAIGTGTLLVLGAGWFVTLTTRYKTAGQALTFLGCVVAPLNLWYYHAQDLVRVDNHLWVGGVVCCLLYIATVRVLRSPVFIYAVELGVSLTTLLLLADLPLQVDAGTVAVCFLVMGLLSIHAERAFPAGDSEFSRTAFGLPLFWSGQVQLGIALVAVAKMQIVDLVLDHAEQNTMLAAGVWLAAAYAYLYSDLVVRRIGVYIYAAACSLLIALLTLASGYLNTELAILILAITALAANLADRKFVVEMRFTRIVTPLGLLLSGVPILLGWLLHVRATSEIARGWHWDEPTGLVFVGVMMAVAVCNRVSAWLYRAKAPKRAVTYLFYTAAALMIAAAGLLRVVGLERWSEQAPLLMVIPLMYLVAARLWRGHLEERALSWVAQAGTGIILFHGLISIVDLSAVLTPRQGELQNLLLSIVFAEAALFYALATAFRRSFQGGYLVAAAACASLWQLLGYAQVPVYLHTLMFAILGVLVLGLSRLLGIRHVDIYRSSGRQAKVIRGPGQAAFQAGNAILSIAFLAALLQGVSRLATNGSDWHQLLALALTTLASVLAVGMVPGGLWRRTYVVYTVALAGLTFLAFNVLIDLSGWQRLEIFCTVAGIALLVFGYIGRFTESEGKRAESVDIALALGSVLATVPLLAAVVYHRFFGAGISLPDELALLTVTLLLVLTGFSWQIKSPTLFGGFSLVVYLCILVASLAYQPQLSQGVYLAVGGLLIFGAGVLLSIYRDRLLQLPDRMARREGIFRIMNWR